MSLSLSCSKPGVQEGYLAPAGLLCFLPAQLYSFRHLFLEPNSSVILCQQSLLDQRADCLVQRLKLFSSEFGCYCITGQCARWLHSSTSERLRDVDYSGRRWICQLFHAQVRRCRAAARSQEWARRRTKADAGDHSQHKVSQITRNQCFLSFGLSFRSLPPHGMPHAGHASALRAEMFLKILEEAI